MTKLSGWFKKIIIIMIMIMIINIMNIICPFLLKKINSLYDLQWNLNITKSLGESAH